jgi:hypothetical protein
MRNKPTHPAVKSNQSCAATKGYEGHVRCQSGYLIYSVTLKEDNILLVPTLWAGAAGSDIQTGKIIQPLAAPAACLDQSANRRKTTRQAGAFATAACPKTMAKNKFSPPGRERSSTIFQKTEKSKTILFTPVR